MDGVTVRMLFDLAANLGLPGVVLVMWYLSDRRTERLLRQYENDMREQRQMYIDSVKLVKQYASLSDDLKDIVIMNTQAWQQAQDAIAGNQFCPGVRLKKHAEGIQV